LAIWQDHGRSTPHGIIGVAPLISHQGKREVEPEDRFLGHVMAPDHFIMSAIQTLSVVLVEEVEPSVVEHFMSLITTTANAAETTVR